MDFRFESQEQHNGQPTQPPNEVWSHVPSRRSVQRYDQHPFLGAAAGRGEGRRLIRLSLYPSKAMS
jgi:hypothetical protein